MINSIEIHNFQSHKHSRLEFHPGMNVIIGGSDSGKTAILRALRWLVWNRPAGDAFRSNWGGDTVVNITVDGKKITRRKTDKTNEYALDGMPYVAFGTDVPDDIQKLLNLNDINLQSQLDAPFLLSKSAGEVAAHFNRVAHLEKIDRGIQNISTWLRRLERDADVKEAALVDQQEQLKDYDDLDKIEIRIELLERDQATLQNQFSAILRLEKLTDDIIHYSAQITALEPLIVAEKGINELLDQQAEIQKQRNEQKTIQNIIRQITTLDHDIRQQSDVLEAEKEVTQLIRTHNKWAATMEKCINLNHILGNIESLDGRIKTEAAELKTLEIMFAKNFPDTCPLCGKPK